MRAANLVEGKGFCRGSMGPPRYLWLTVFVVVVVLCVEHIWLIKLQCQRELNNDEPTQRGTSWASRESYGVLNDILDSSWKVMRDHARSFDQYFPGKDGPRLYLNKPNVWYCQNLLPILNCPHVTRVGGHGDGPKWICNPQHLRNVPGCLIYSIGSGGSVEWEDAMVKMLNKSCEIHVFDPNPAYERPGDVAGKNIHFHPWGLNSSQPSNIRSRLYSVGKTQIFKTFQEILKELGHETRRIDILKVDCEGCEWATYKDWIGHDIGQIAIEVHGVPYDKMDPSSLFDAFPQNGFAMYSKEVNPLGPQAVEFSFLKMHPSFWDNASIFNHPNFGNRIPMVQNTKR